MRTNPMTTYTAIIFDMDGVLADSEPVYHAAAQAVLAPLGHEVTEEHQRAVMGRSIEDTWDYLRRALGLEGSIDTLIQAYDQELLRRLALLHEPLPGVRELLDALRRAGLPAAVASSSLPSWIDVLLDGLGLSGAFDARVSASQVPQPKPAPDIYLEAARCLGKAPAQCIAIEDTPTGLTAAKAAGMLTVQVRSSSTAWPPQPNADVVLDSLRAFDLGLVTGSR